MNIFEDLVEELKGEHLLERTVGEESLNNFESDAGNTVVTGSVITENIQNPVRHQDIGEDDLVLDEELFETERFLEQLEAEENAKTKSDHEELPHQELFGDSEPSNEVSNAAPPPNDEELELFRKRAIAEVASLQMVDHIFTNVEREQMKVAPRPYDDLVVKKILHSLTQQSDGLNSSAQSRAEFKLRLETENWYTTLAFRDENISVENLRYSCETTRPPLSPPALLALARFYRNLPFTEKSRNKFELIISRLFSQEIATAKRELVFTREELTGHLTELYEEWESVSFYSLENDAVLIGEIETKINKFVEESQRAQTFDDLINSGFFNRIRSFKKETGEYFFAPVVVSAAIICNVQIGNRYLQLLEQEKSAIKNVDLETALINPGLEDRYGLQHDRIVSDALSKTLQISDLLKEIKDQPAEVGVPEFKPAAMAESKPRTRERRVRKPGFFDRILAVNKILLGLTVFTVVGTAVLFLWVELDPPKSPSPTDVVQIDMAQTEFTEYIQTAKINNEALFAIVKPGWQQLPKAEQETIVKKMVLFGKTKGFTQIHLLNKDGATIGSGSVERVVIK